MSTTDTTNERLEEIEDRFGHLEREIEHLKTSSPDDARREEMLIYAGLRQMEVLHELADLRGHFRGMIPRSALRWDTIWRSIAVTALGAWLFLICALSVPEMRAELAKHVMTDTQRYFMDFGRTTWQEREHMEEAAGASE